MTDERHCCGDDNNYQKDAEFILFQLELFKNREELIESSNLKKEYIP